MPVSELMLVTDCNFMEYPTGVWGLKKLRADKIKHHSLHKSEIVDLKEANVLD